MASILGPIGGAAIVYAGAQVIRFKASKILGLSTPRPDPLNTLPTHRAHDNANNSPDVQNQSDWNALIGFNNADDCDPAPFTVDAWRNAVGGEAAAGLHRHWNQSFEHFNSQDPALNHVKEQLNRAANSDRDSNEALTANTIQSVIQQTQESCFDKAVETLKATGLRACEKATLIKAVIRAAEHRNIRNISSFIARAERENRHVNASEKEMIKLWMQQLIHLYQGYNELEGVQDGLDRDSLNIFLNTLECNDNSITALLEPFKQAHSDSDEAHAQDDANQPVLDPNLERERAPEWKSRFHNVIKPAADNFGYEIEHADRIPQTGRTIINLNHGMFTFDMGFLIDQIRESRQRDVRMTVDRMLNHIPLAGSILNLNGFHEGAPSSFLGFLAKDKALGVAPGGMNEALNHERNKLLQGTYQLDDGSIHQAPIGHIRYQLLSGAPSNIAYSPRADDIVHASDNIFTRLGKKIRLPIGALNIMFGVNNVKMSTYVSKAIPAAIMPESHISVASKSMKLAINRQNSVTIARANAIINGTDKTMPFKLVQNNRTQ